MHTRKCTTISTGTTITITKTTIDIVMIKNAKNYHVDIQKIKCLNNNVNVNGVDITEIPQDAAGLAAANEAGEGPDGANTQNGNGLGDRINFDRNLVNICVNVNDNEQTKVTPQVNTTRRKCDLESDQNCCLHPPTS